VRSYGEYVSKSSNYLRLTEININIKIDTIWTPFRIFVKMEFIIKFRFFMMTWMARLSGAMTVTADSEAEDPGSIPY
jgi:hypothetical protein